MHYLHIKNTTGTLSVTTFADNATISITQDNKNAVVVGTGTAKLRLDPGTYQLAASSNGVHNTAQTTITLKGHNTVHIGKPIPVVSSSDDVTFTGIDILNDRGLTADQTDKLRILFFEYNSKAATVTVDPDSIVNGPHLHDDDPFTKNFTGKIGAQKYRATITFSDLEDLELTLYDPQTGAKLFDANSSSLD